MIQPIADPRNIALRKEGDVRSLGNECAYPPVGILHESFLPGMVRVTEVYGSEYCLQFSPLDEGDVVVEREAGDRIS